MAMRTKELILKLLKRKGSVRTSEIIRHKNLTRQTVAQHFRELIEVGALVKLGSTRNAHYVLASSQEAKRAKQPPKFTSHYKRQGLSEDRVFDQASLKLRLKKLLSEEGYQIARYAFTEMLNNAVDHSGARTVSVWMRCTAGNFKFEVRDRGVGAFENMRQKFGLRDHFEAAEHMLKGKQTTDIKHHTGQGIFFTSKIADHFVLASRRLKLTVDNRIQDTFIADIKNTPGTQVTFSMRQKTRKNLKALFDQYSDSEYEFDKTQVIVRLLKKEGEYVSRSEAKRLLIGLDRFKRIVLDFKGTPGIGQGFSDEIFRVFQQAHPQIELKPINMSEGVAYMVNRSIQKP